MASALGQGRHQGLHQLPDDQGAVSRLPPGPARRREDRIQGVGEEHALFRGLHADRGDGRARRRHAALRADEAGRPRRSASTGRWPYAVVQLRQDNALGTLVEHGRLPDQAEACRAGAAVPHHSGPRECRVRAARRAAPQHLHQFAAAARRHAAAEGGAAHPLRRPDHRLRGLCRIGGDRPARRAASPRRS